MRQSDVSAKAGISRSTQSRIERGDAGGVTLDTLDAVAKALSMRVDIVPRWRGMDLPRLLDALHAALAEMVIRRLRSIGGWELHPEVSFSVFGERGSMDILAWHARTRTLLVIELKTAIVDLQDALSTLDRKRRLANGIAHERSWRPEAVAVWLAVGDTRTNRRHVAAHEALLAAALPVRGREVDGWLRDPTGPVAALSFVSYGRQASARQPAASRRACHMPSPAARRA